MARIDEEIDNFKKDVQYKNELYNDETRMRAIINENIIPIVNIAKENMLTNVMKNSEL